MLVQVFGLTCWFFKHQNETRVVWIFIITKVSLVSPKLTYLSFLACSRSSISLLRDSLTVSISLCFPLAYSQWCFIYYYYYLWYLQLVEVLICFLHLFYHILELQLQEVYPGFLQRPCLSSLAWVYVRQMGLSYLKQEYQDLFFSKQNFSIFCFQALLIELFTF